MAVGDVFRFAVIGNNQGIDELVNVHHYVQTSAGGDDEGVDLIDAWVANVMPSFLDTFSELCSLVGFQVRNINQPEFGTDYSLPASENGTLTGEMVPPQVAPVISWRTGLIGRRRRGRSFGWPINEGSQNAGQMSLTLQALLTEYANDALAFAGGAAYEKVIYSNIEGATPPVLVTTVNSVVVDVILGSQRRRKPGVGS